jgi:hypothetical protein
LVFSIFQRDEEIYEMELEKRIIEWICHVLGKPKPELEFLRYIKDGTVFAE